MDAIGCDVGKRLVDVCWSDVESFQVANERGAIEAFAHRLPPGCVVGMEATGQYHELLADTLALAGHRVYVINARWIHAYRRGVGMRGKTDRTDAEVIARYVEAEHRSLHPYEVPSPEQRELKHLLQRRIAAARLMATARQSLGQDAESVVTALRSTCKDLERRIAKLIRSKPQWAALEARLRQIPGIGPLTSAHLVSTLARIPFTRVDAFVAHTGTDPRPNDSGQRRGRRILSRHGDGSLRSLLYMAAMAAARNSVWKPYYQTQIDKGMKSTAALIVVARRLARIAYAVFKSGQAYDPHRCAPRPA